LEAKFRRADIVIIASAHNPSIIAPQWLKDNSLIIEEPRHFVHTRDFSLFESESFSLVIDHQRLQITAKKQDKGSLMSLANIAANYVKLLPHIPYRSLGLNFVWSIEVDEGEKLPKIGLNINKGDLASVFEGCKVDYGGIVYARMEPYMLKLVIEPQGENTLIHNFNYHHELGAVSIADLTRLIDNLLIRYEDSSRIVTALSSIGERK
jgi:hypothetical protein